FEASLFFFFQAEDGIRDLIVTGVQTCALPIFQGDPGPGKPLVPATNPPEPGTPVWTRFRATPVFTAPDGPHDWMNRTVFVANARSEERRVGKECRTRGRSEREKNIASSWRDGE